MRQNVGGCICPKPEMAPNGAYFWTILPECPYHAYAAAHPDDHSIPWNCPTYYDGCNCTTEQVSGSQS